jgi:hypothetical protein
MDEHTQTAAVRRRRTRAQAEELVAEYEASGLSQADFCRSRGLSLATLTRYRRRGRESGGESSAGGRWLAVEVAGGGAAAAGGAPSGLAVSLGSGRKIEVGRGFDPPTLVQLLHVLERF